MIRAHEYLDQVKKNHSLTSDYQLASFLGISQAAISRYRNKKNYLDNYTALIVAKVLNIDPLKIIAKSSLERAKRPEEKKAWKTLLKNITSTTALFFIALITTTNFIINTSLGCILC